MLLVRGEPEEPVSLLDPLGLDVVLRALPVDQLVLRLERLAADAVETRVDVLVDVVASVVADPLQELLDEPLVAVVARPDEEVVGDVEAGGERPPRLDDLVRVLLRLEPLFGGDARDLRGVLVDPGEEERLTPALPLMAREDVRGDRRVRVTDVRGRVHVVDRRRDVVALHCDRFYGRPSAGTPTATTQPRANAATSGPSGAPLPVNAVATTSADGARTAAREGSAGASRRAPGEAPRPDTAGLPAPAPFLAALSPAPAAPSPVVSATRASLGVTANRSETTAAIGAIRPSPTWAATAARDVPGDVPSLPPRRVGRTRRSAARRSFRRPWPVSVAGVTAPTPDDPSAPTIGSDRVGSNRRRRRQIDRRRRRRHRAGRRGGAAVGGRGRKPRRRRRRRLGGHRRP